MPVNDTLNQNGETIPKYEFVEDDEGGLSLLDESEGSENDKTLPLLVKDFEF